MRHRNLQTIYALADSVKYEIPDKAYRAFCSQLHSAKRRNIPFLFTLPEWWAWWQVDNRWGKRGLKGNGLVMARLGDKGPYSPENIECISTAKNVRDADPRSGAEKRRASWKAKTPAERAKWHLSVRGDGHPRSRAVLTPKGRFGSASLAAEAFGFTRQWATSLARLQLQGWRYESEAEPSA